MGTSDVSYDALVVGGGIIGCSAARELATDHDVLVLEKDQVAGSASGKASGVVSFSAQRSALPEFVEYALSFFHDYDGTDHFEFVERHAVELTPPEKLEEARERVDGAVREGFPLSFRPPDELESRYPDVFDFSGYAGGIEYRDTGWVDPYTCTVSYREDAEDRGADFRTGTEVENIVVRDGAVAGVEVDDGTIRSHNVVCATGWLTRQLLEGLVDVPVRPIRYQAVDLAPDRRLDDEYPMGLDPVTGFYWRPQRDGTLHLGGGDYLVENPGRVREQVTEAFRKEVALEIPERLKGFETADIVTEDTCPTGDAATPDSLPIIDAPAAGPEGLVVSTGFHGYGIMSSPAAGRAVRSLIADEACPFSFDALALDRFDTSGADFDLISLSEKRAKFG